MNMREIIDRLNEGMLSRSAGVYYHASKVKLSVGTILTSRNQNMLDNDIEEILESYRPANKPARSQVVFMAKQQYVLEHLAPSADFLYEVRPVGQVYSFDHEWANVIWHTVAKAEGESSSGLIEWTPSLTKKVAALAGFYWSEVANWVGHPRLMEYCCSSASVIAEREWI